jgi:aspartyl-tRNA(Asn)/glutamyl-tRNA(Gln) amidotransferase subunit A
MTSQTGELCLLTIEDAAKLIEAKKLSPVELADAVLARIEQLDPQLNAYMTVTAEAARAEAKTAESEIAAGKRRGPLHGVPIAHKDLFATKGIRTTAGSKILSDWLPDEDAVVVTKLRNAGAINLGKLGMHEWAYGLTSDNVHFGAIHNPWDVDCVPGGSSGGSGAAVTAGIAFAATGSDTGGSIRIPAAFCGCVGLMPTYGRVSLRGAVPLSWTMDHAGPLTRTVRDAAIVLQTMAGHDPLDLTTAPVPVPDYLDGVESGAKGLRVGVPKQYFWESLDAPVEKLARKALDDLEAAGAELREVDYPHAQAYFGAANLVLLGDASAYHAAEHNFPASREQYSPQVAALLDAGMSFTGVQVAGAQRRMQIARNGEADALLDGVDVLAIPTTPCVAPTIEGIRAKDETFRMVAGTAVIDFTGEPAIAVPCGLADGMPASISFVARRWDEATMLRAARAYEQVRGAFPAPSL